MNINIRLAEKRDIEAITEFNMAMALETEGKKLDRHTLESGVEAMFENDEHGFYIVAENESNTVGSLMITTEWSDWRNGLFWWIQSVYVKEEFRRKGIYRKMYEFIKDQAKKDDKIAGFRLYVEKNNLAARKVYESLGMQETYYRLYEETK